MEQLQAIIKNILQAIEFNREMLYQRCLSFLKQYTGWLAMAAIIGVASLSFMFQSGDQVGSSPKGQVQGITISTTSAILDTDSKSDTVIKVDVSGAVNQPGVISLRPGDRVEDAIRQANGLTEQADTAYVAMAVNLAAKVQDGDKIFIPVKGQNTIIPTISTSAPSSANSAIPAVSNGKVSINRGSTTELDALPGIGETYAQRIIAGRPYSSIDDLCSRSDIFRSKSTCTKIQSLITL